MLINSRNQLPRAIVAAIAKVVGHRPVALHEPRFQGNERTYLRECLDSTFVSSVGPFVDRFEADLAAYTGARHAVAVVNGTAALHVALMLAGVQPGDEVLVPALSFVATANAVCYCGAQPHFVDSELPTLGLAPTPLREYLGEIAEQRAGQCINRRTGKVIRALVPMHTFGHPVDIDGLMALARDFNLALVEDAAESLGSFYKGRHTGGFGLLGTLSFNGNKTITTGGGGAILINDPQLAQYAKHLTTTAKLAHRWFFEHDEVGYNYRLPNLNAALGCAQLEQLPVLLAEKRRLYERYREAFAGVPGVYLFGEPDGCSSNYWLQTLLLDPVLEDARDSVLTATNEAGQMTRPAWNLLPSLLPFRHCQRAPLPVAESLERRVINIPSSSFLV
ncbi:MAG: LegC family aminotransferase [Gammaproteobacteria bacterium]|nr:LegC family aminotransferase [Gammaproteobacteria bacterium]MBU0788283.1 LegC family aminotransferase [Gammaproteobacteria bacterium]MBU0815220.1 LegC family aminotransferase [Gammaproteobacteria bacterium]MBU1785672.1 LegC family aminotransferase [Gammaproteobacteria bacterium]